MSHTGTGLDEYSQIGTEFEDENDEDEEDNSPEVISRQKLMSPMEAKDHIEKLWSKEKELLDIMYGRYVRSSEADGGAFETDSMGAQMFFMTKMLVPPNRFRPES